MGSVEAGKYIRRHMERLKAGWLLAAAEEMATAVKRDWRAWKKAKRR